MVVYRTMANPACVDASLDPSPRDYGSLLSERPDLMNYAALGLARTVTPRAWLSTWSGLSSNADLVANVARITEPTLIVHAERDREIRPTDATLVLEACASRDKRLVDDRRRATLLRARAPASGGTARRAGDGCDRAVDPGAARMTAIAVVYHSASGRTRALAEAVARGAESGEERRQRRGAPPVGRGRDSAHMRCSRPQMRSSSDAHVHGQRLRTVQGVHGPTSAVWALQGWRDKLAAGFTHSAAPSGDKLGTLTQLAVFAAQHGMVWVGLGLPPTYAASDSSRRRHESPRQPSRGDGAVASRRRRASARRPEDGGASRAARRGGGATVGRGAGCACGRGRGRRGVGAVGSDEPERHPAARSWAFPRGRACRHCPAGSSERTCAS